MAWRPTPRVRRERTGVPTRGVGAVFAGMRIRKKLLFLHTVFSLVLAAVLALAIRPSIHEVVSQAELHEAAVLLDLVVAERDRAREAGQDPEQAVARLAARLGGSVSVRMGDATSLGIGPVDADLLRAQRSAAPVQTADDGDRQAIYDPATGQFLTVGVVLQGARQAVVRLYILVTLALLAVYALVALALEVFVLPQHVYGPLGTLLRADQALQDGRIESELVPESAIPADELGDIMHSRNESIRSLRRHEHDLAAALSRLEEANADLVKKNHLLEMARRNLADADRLASLGMMSAGIAHELNTPLAVLKGLAERAAGQPGSGPPLSPDESALMLRVVGRLEKLSESLLDFARVRPHRSLSVAIEPLVEEAWTLVRLDREAQRVQFVSDVPSDLTAWVDPDRILQVLVNLLRNAVDATTHARPATSAGAVPPVVQVHGERIVREGRRWARLRITDNGPGIPPEMLGRLFQPFASTRLDANGTGLGLAVTEGIVREHGGLIVARNIAGNGAEFEVLLPEADAVVGGTPEAAARAG
jgi:signal transduction histidine kinase